MLLMTALMMAYKSLSISIYRATCFRCKTLPNTLSEIIISSESIQTFCMKSSEFSLIFVDISKDFFFHLALRLCCHFLIKRTLNCKYIYTIDKGYLQYFFLDLQKVNMHLAFMKQYLIWS